MLVTTNVFHLVTKEIIIVSDCIHSINRDLLPKNAVQTADTTNTERASQRGSGALASAIKKEKYNEI